MRRRATCDARGFTLAEVMVAAAVLSIGLVGIAMGFQYATSGVATGRGETTATFLAEQRLEQLKALAIADWTNATLNAGTTTDYCPSTGAACTTTATTGFYRRVTTIVDTPGGTGCTANCKRVQVQVFYRPVTSRGELDQERDLTVLTVLVPRS
jgi:prepilin-type N-terminal cleavage/methylation domain-containing protein